MGTTSQKLQAIANSKAAIKAAIEAKGVTGVGDVLSAYAGKIADIPAGGGGWEANAHLIRWWDIDGTILKEEYVSTGGAATPPDTIPTHPHLTHTGWNFTEEEYGNITGPLDIGAEYSTEGDATWLKVYVPAGKRVTFSKSADIPAVVNWGDGTTETVTTATAGHSYFGSDFSGYIKISNSYSGNVGYGYGTGRNSGYEISAFVIEVFQGSNDYSHDFTGAMQLKSLKLSVAGQGNTKYLRPYSYQPGRLTAIFPKGVNARVIELSSISNLKCLSIPFNTSLVTFRTTDTDNRSCADRIILPNLTDVNYTTASAVCSQTILDYRNCVEFSYAGAPIGNMRVRPNSMSINAGNINMSVWNVETVESVFNGLKEATGTTTLKFLTSNLYLMLSDIPDAIKAIAINKGYTLA